MNRIVIKCRSRVDTYTPKQVAPGSSFLDGADRFEMLTGALDAFVYGYGGVIPEVATCLLDAAVWVGAHVADGEGRQDVLPV